MILQHKSRQDSWYDEAGTQRGMDVVGDDRVSISTQILPSQPQTCGNINSRDAKLL
jgi:hypothetical protein